MLRSNQTDVVVVGATCLDVKARPLAPISPNTSSPARLLLSAGGAGRNVAENLALLGVKTALLSVVGTDMVGQRLLDKTARAGVDVSRVIRSQEASTGAYLALFTDANQKGYALDDVSQLKLATPEYVQRHRTLLRTSKMIFMDGNVDTETVASVLDLVRRHDVRVCMDPVSVRRAYALRPYYSELFMVTPNRAEAEALLDVSIQSLDDALDAAGAMVAAGVSVAIVTLAEDGLVYATSEARGRIPSIRCDVVDWTGAGAALSAAIIYGMLNEMSVDDCMRLGVAAATLTLGSLESVHPEMSLDQLYSNMVV